jgi:hypothetical protein
MLRGIANPNFPHPSANRIHGLPVVGLAPMLDLVELMPRLTPSRLWKRTQTVECAASELDRLERLYKILYQSATPFGCWWRDRRLAIFELNCCFRIGIIRRINIGALQSSR